MLLPKPNQAVFETVPAGTYVARCYRFLDLGTQPISFEGKTKLVHQIRLSWELPTELMTKGEYEGKPFSTHRSFTWSMHEKATLRNTLENWRGKKFVESDFGEGGFDTHKLLGAPCMIGISHTEKQGNVYSKVTSVSPLLKGYQMPPAVNEPMYFSFDDLSGLPHNAARQALDVVLSKLAQGTRDMLCRTPEYAKAIGNGSVDEHESMGNMPPAAIPDDAFGDSIPF